MYHDEEHSRGSQPSGTSRLVRVVLYAVGFVAFLCLIIITAMAVRNNGKNFGSGTENEQELLYRGPNCKPLPRFSPEIWDTNKDRPKHTTPPKLIKNGRGLINGTVVENFAVLIDENGKIKEAGKDINPKLDAIEVIDAGGKFILPGLVDSHSHLGVYSFPQLWGQSDGNELTAPITPFVRAIDALNSKDIAIEQILRGGVTSSLVLPGSGNVMGGEGVIVKNKRGLSNSDMLLPGAPRALKMACGENPKRVYGRNKGEMPYSRMGSAWLMRQTFEAARNLIAEQDAFDCTSQPSHARRPEKLELLPLTYLLRGHPNITLHIHCYETQDIEMLFRLSDEFGFKIDTLQHALEAYKIGDKIRQRNITVATFDSMFGFKTEAYESSANGAPLLEKAGVNVVLKSDHPVTHAHWLLSSAGRAHYYGMTAGGAIDAVTINPAKGLKLGHRIGALKPGYDADIAIFDRHPLLLGARADKVFIDGQLLVDKELPLKSDKTKLYAPNSPIKIQKATGGECKNRIVYKSYVIEDAQLYTMNEQVIEKGKIVVENGNISCIGTAQTCSTPEHAVVFSVAGGIVTPGLVEGDTELGLVEISSESNTFDGADSGGSEIRARDAIRMDSRTMDAAFRGGVTTAVTHRQGDSLANGQSVAFSTHGRFISESIVQDSVAYQINFGSHAKSGGSISTQRRNLYNWLKNLPNTHDIKRLNRPVVVRSHQADDIDQLLTMQEELGFKLIILGGAEAHLHAEKLAARQDVHVILTPISEDEGYYMSWDTRRSSFDYGASVLAAKGVSFGIGTGNTPHEVRNLRWTAGLLSKEGISDLPYLDALAAVTSRVADMYNLPFGVGRLVVGTQANFVLFEGNPLTYEGRPKLVAVGDCLECGEQLNQF